ncbi:MAG: cell envelope integrity protein TolA [Candidatus Eremiobacteraeota bacterium]|nr:cell envelope integrity protein TolA [Candidatus Eremiobacteraeota bacterium]
MISDKVSSQASTTQAAQTKPATTTAAAKTDTAAKPAESKPQEQGDNVALTDQAQKDAEKARVEKERQEALAQAEKERQEKLKALEEEEKRKQEEINAQQLEEQEKLKKEEALKAEVEAKKKAIEEEAAKKNAAIEEKYQTDMTKAQGPTMPANFNDMTPEQQYNYLHDVAVAMAGGDESQWRTGENELNLIGIRSWQNGQAGSTEGNKYNDTIYAVRMVNGNPEVYAFNGTVDAGRDPGGTGYGYSGPEGSGFSHVADGSYPIGTFEKRGGGKWGVDTTLGQSGDVRINVDFNNDAVIQDNERLNKTEGAGWGIYFHPGGSGENVGSWSAGCQVIRPDQYGTFQSLIQQDPNKQFGYTLVDSANLPPVNSAMEAVGVPNTPVATGTGGVSITPHGTAPAATGGTAAPYHETAPYTAHAPEGYMPPEYGSPYGAQAPDSMAFNPQGANIDEQLTLLCEEAMKEIESQQALIQGGGQAQWGNATLALYYTYYQALFQELPLKPETEQLINTTLAKAGIDAPRIKEMVSEQKQSLQANPLAGQYFQGGMQQI